MVATHDEAMNKMVNVYLTNGGTLREDMETAMCAYLEARGLVMVPTWREGIESAPYASTVLASYLDQEYGEWVVQVFAAERLSAPFTHWMEVPAHETTAN